MSAIYSMENVIKSPHMNIMTEVLHKQIRTLVRDFNEIVHISSYDIRQEFIDKYIAKSDGFVSNYLHNLYPDYSIISKNLEFKGESEFTWIINSLNGVDNFIRHIPHFAFSIAVMQEDKIISSIVIDPLKHELFYAEVGKKAFRNHKIIRTFKPDSDKNRIISASNDISTLSDINTVKIRNMGSDLLDIIYVACGRLDSCVIDAKDRLCHAGIIFAEEAKIPYEKRDDKYIFGDIDSNSEI